MTGIKYLAYVVRARKNYSGYFSVAYILVPSEMLVLNAALGRAGLAFHWLTPYPARERVNVGAWLLRYGWGVFAVIPKAPEIQEWLFFVNGRFFVAERISSHDCRLFLVIRNIQKEKIGEGAERSIKVNGTVCDHHL